MKEVRKLIIIVSQKYVSCQKIRDSVFAARFNQSVQQRVAVDEFGSGDGEGRIVGMVLGKEAQRADLSVRATAQEIDERVVVGVF